MDNVRTKLNRTRRWKQEEIPFICAKVRLFKKRKFIHLFLAYFDYSNLILLLFTYFSFIPTTSLPLLLPLEKENLTFLLLYPVLYELHVFIRSNGWYGKIHIVIVIDFVFLFFDGIGIITEPFVETKYESIFLFVASSLMKSKSLSERMKCFN